MASQKQNIILVIESTYIDIISGTTNWANVQSGTVSIGQALIICVEQTQQGIVRVGLDDLEVTVVHVARVKDQYDAIVNAIPEYATHGERGDAFDVAIIKLNAPDPEPSSVLRLGAVQKTFSEHHPTPSYPLTIAASSYEQDRDVGRCKYYPGLDMHKAFRSTSFMKFMNRVVGLYPKDIIEWANVFVSNPSPVTQFEGVAGEGFLRRLDYAPRKVGHDRAYEIATTLLYDVASILVNDPRAMPSMPLDLISFFCRADAHENGSLQAYYRSITGAHAYPPMFDGLGRRMVTLSTDRDLGECAMYATDSNRGAILMRDGGAFERVVSSRGITLRDVDGHEIAIERPDYMCTHLGGIAVGANRYFLIFLGPDAPARELCGYILSAYTQASTYCRMWDDAFHAASAKDPRVTMEDVRPNSRELHGGGLGRYTPSDMHIIAEYGETLNKLAYIYYVFISHRKLPTRFLRMTADATASMLGLYTWKDVLHIAAGVTLPDNREQLPVGRTFAE